MDFMVAKDLARLGYGREQVKLTIQEGSPNLTDRKKGSLDDYLSRTIQMAFDSLSMDKGDGPGMIAPFMG